MKRAELENLVSNLTANSGQNCSTPLQTTTERPTSDFTKQERDATGYFFAKLLALYANVFYLVYPSEKEVVFAKRQYAKEIGAYSREQIDEAMRQLAKLAISTERECKLYREPNIPAILAMMDECVRQSRAHKLFLPTPQETEEKKAERLELGKKNAAALLAMFDEPQPDELADK